MLVAWGNNQHVLEQSGPAYSAEAIALFARFTTPATGARKTLIDTLIQALKAGAISGSNIWAKLDAFYVMAAADAQAAQRNWIADTFNLVPSTTVATLPVFVADRGYTPDGTTGYLSTGFNPTTAPGPQYALNSARLSFWSRTAAGGGATAGDMGATTLAGSSARNVGDLGYIAINSAISGFGSGATFPSTDGSGLFSFNRSGAASGALQAYRNGVALVLSGPDASSAIPNSNVLIGASGAGPLNFGVKQYAAASIGGSLTANEELDVYNAVQAYMTAIGA